MTLARTRQGKSEKQYFAAIGMTVLKLRMTNLPAPADPLTSQASLQHSRISASGLQIFDPPESTPRWTWWETAVLALYAAVIAFGIHQHVPWTDEAQAWMLARSVSLPTLLSHSLHYEGTPGLWHCLLHLLAALGFSFTSARWIAGGIAASGVVVLLRYSPFPRVVRLLLPFSFFLAYQDAVIARSYVLFAVFAFAAAAMLRSATARPRALALVLGLMANISLHALLASLGLAVVAAAVWRRRFERRPFAATGLLLVFWLVALATMAPARDVDFSAGSNVWQSLTRFERHLGIRAVGPPAVVSLPMAGLPPFATLAPVRTAAQKRWNKLARVLSVITFPLARYRWLALLLVSLVVAQACLQRPRPAHAASALRGAELPAAVGLAPYLLMVAVFTSLYLEPRHAGMVFTGFVVSAWLTWPTQPAAARLLLLMRVTTAVFALALVLQAGWTLDTLRSEHDASYSPDLATAGYLKQHLGGRPAAGFYYYSVGPLLYFDRNLYLNQPPHPYWLWSTRMRAYATVEQVLAARPAIIVIGGFEPGPESEITRDWLPALPAVPAGRLGDSYRLGEYFRSRGYHETALFCGHSWMRSSYAEQVCQSVLEPDAASFTNP